MLVAMMLVTAAPVFADLTPVVAACDGLEGKERKLCLTHEDAPSPAEIDPSTPVKSVDAGAEAINAHGSAAAPMFARFIGNSRATP